MIFMKLKNIFHIFAIISILFSSCKHNKVQEDTSNKPIIKLNPNNQTVELSGLEYLALEELKTDSLPDSLWSNFFAIYEEPSDPEMRDFQPALEGNYTIKGAIVRFKPKHNFKKNQLYFARSYNKLLLHDAEDLIKTRELFHSDGFIEYKFKIIKKN